ncbi:probable WRKY transcription factor 13 [Impatiens glandulifera]|uniref:probable WRKY transcription factor 13 n=1 Tax=Impatiens glandulifera TaxID=253017 RepID=UPI001FB0A173|nr:probable WRKY transcription factor 13 [Impatiens glandulifera]
MSITTISQAMLNQGGLFDEDDQDIPSQMGFLAPMISSTNLNALKTLISDSPSALSSDDHHFLLSSRQTQQDFSHPLGKSQIYPLQRSSSANINWAWGEMEERMMRGGKRNNMIVNGGDYDHEHVHHLGVGTMKMKKVIKVRRKVREPRFCFKTMSDVDVLDDGYKWRKYGQKVVKNTQHPRSYYRCTQENCRVKKRVERLAEDPRMVITTYEGRHVHSPSHDEDEHSHSPSNHHHQLSNFFW